MPAAEQPSVDRGRGYLRRAATANRDDEIAAFALAERFYGSQLGAAVTRALHMVPSSSRLDDRPNAGVFALLHRLVDETGATIDDVRQAGLSDEAVALIDAISPRPGETPKQTALRAVANAQAVRSIVGHGSDLVLFSRPKRAADWWPTDPDAWDIINGEDERLDELERQQRDAESYHYSLPGEALQAAGVPPVWANAVKDAFRRLTDAEYSEHGYGRNHRFQGRRVVRIDRGKHLVECYEAGMTPEQYAYYVDETRLTWKQMAAWQRAGLAPELVRDVGRLFDYSPEAVTAAIELTGDARRVGELVRWARMVASAETFDTGRPLSQALDWSAWREDDQRVDTPKRARIVWQAYVTVVGSEQQARRLLDLRRIVPVPPKTTPRGGTRPDRDAYQAAVAAWERTGLSVERVELLIAAGVTDPAQAVEAETAALSDEQLRLAATL